MKRHDATADDVAKMTMEERTKWEPPPPLGGARWRLNEAGEEETLALDGALWRIRRGGRIVGTYGTRLEAQRAMKEGV